MFLTVIHFFNILVFLNLLLALLSCVLLIKTPLRYGIKYILIPLILFVSYIFVVEGENIFGRPYEIYPKGNFYFIDYRVLTVDGVKKIELWAIQDKKSRLFLFNYNEKTEQELSKAKTRKSRGSVEAGKFQESEIEGLHEGLHQGEMTEPSLTIKSVPMDVILPPKDE